MTYIPGERVDFGKMKPGEERAWFEDFIAYQGRKSEERDHERFMKELAKKFPEAAKKEPTQ